MKRLLVLDDATSEIRKGAGPKAAALAAVAQARIDVPGALFISAAVYSEFVHVTGLRNGIVVELGRKPIEEMRWEEMWDASLRIRNLFLNTPLPPDLGDELAGDISARFRDTPLAVRSSALSEDAAGASFAGLHESYLNIRGVEEVLRHVVLVWASLWSDAALLYRRELGLTVDESAMGVILQEMVLGEKSGVAFGVSPENDARAVVESVHGLNKGLVDGDVEPDRWILDRKSGRILEWTPASRERMIVPAEEGIRAVNLDGDRAARPPLSDSEVLTVYGTVNKLGNLFGSPQDVEWTFLGGRLYILQSRPITTRTDSGGDNRSWYLSLRRSFSNLQDLGARIEGELLPAMEEEAEELGALDLASLDGEALATEIERRQLRLEAWRKVYWEDFIPFAHGARLFGEVYNNQLHPEDPFEFISLLTSEDMKSTERNAMLMKAAEMIRERQQEPTVEAVLADSLLGAEIDRIIPAFRGLTSVLYGGGEERTALTGLLVQMAVLQQDPDREGRRPSRRVELEQRYLASFDEEERDYGLQLLELGRKSYRLRDDDNLYLGRIESEVERALDAARGKLGTSCAEPRCCENAEEIISGLRGLRPAGGKQRVSGADADRDEDPVVARQLKGQPAGQGIARAEARVIRTNEDLFSFKAGEILVCDAIDPNMTFIVPLAAGIVERRGGMLIHGAIIAREYGLPCVTGVPDAPRYIRTGDLVTVDGYYGLVTVHTDTYGDEREAGG
jgi:pyruvate,water dikinase